MQRVVYESNTDANTNARPTPTPTQLAISTTATMGWASIVVSVNGQPIGTLTKYLQIDPTPSCAAVPGVRLVATVQPGSETYTARSDTGATWNGSVQVASNGCNEVQLTCTDGNCAAPPPPPPSPAPTSALFVWGGSDYSQYLGFFSCVFCTDASADSITNQFGQYGSQFSQTSIRNQCSQYGSQFSSYSACDQFASSPPRVYNAARSVYYGELTLNQFRADSIKASNIVSWLQTNVCAH
jgi:hypothetical protein